MMVKCDILLPPPAAAKKERDSRKGSDSGVQDSSCDKPPSGSHDRKPAQSGDAEGKAIKVILVYSILYTEQISHKQ